MKDKRKKGNTRRSLDPYIIRALEDYETAVMDKEEQEWGEEEIVPSAEFCAGMEKLLNSMKSSKA